MYIELLLTALVICWTILGSMQLFTIKKLRKEIDDLKFKNTFLDISIKILNEFIDKKNAQIEKLKK